MTEEQTDVPFPQLRFVSLLPFAPPVPVIDFPPPEQIENVVYQLLQLKSMPNIVEFFRGSRG